MLSLGFSVDVVDETPRDLKPGINYNPTFWDRVFYKLGFPRDKYQLNRKILSLDLKKYDLIWVEKSLILKKNTLLKLKIKNPKLIFTWFSEDDMTAKHNQSRYFLNTLPLYDIVFTTKSYNCNTEELPRLGAKKVIFTRQGFDKKLHVPTLFSNNFFSEVSFIGTFEEDRANQLLFLAKNGIKINVWGNGWSEWVGKYPDLIIHNKPIYDFDYACAISSSKINLCFLRKINRDLHTDRSLEIPACGGFMLAERTKEHQDLFEEGKEAVYFDVDNSQELLDKIRYYLTHEEERIEIAKAGRERCLRDDYSHESRLKTMFQEIDKIF